ncbi:hypothetical protein EU803_03915 [Loktanella sp. IMCC34160]|nr:hypothetical protein EU803_03915 [Loktanella sp. IMCC34160]
MDWMAQSIDYCERVGFGFWDEPVNAVTNLSFVLAGLVMWGRCRGLPMGRALSALIMVIGVGSFLWHTFATRWAEMADTLPIGIFILTYLFAVNRDMLRWPLWRAALGTAAFIPYAMVVVPLANALPFFRVSNFYWTVPLLLVIYALIFLRGRAEARGFWIGAGLLAVSISVRSVDRAWCEVLPIGTHFLWHTINGVMLGWMVEVYRRSRIT